MRIGASANGPGWILDVGPRTTGTRPGGFFDQFDFNLAIAVLDQLVAEFEKLVPAPLSLESLEEVDRAPGVYQLFLDDVLSYVGKADSNLAKRLGEHRASFYSRKNVDVD